MPAILWDGQKQINGEIQIFNDHLDFVLADFRDTSLNFRLNFKDVINVKYHSIFDLMDKGVIISLKNCGENIFIVEDPIELVSILKEYN